MELVRIGAYAEGYYSESSYYESYFVTKETYNKISDSISNIEFCICGLDGKYSECEADIEVEEFNRDELLRMDVSTTDNNDGKDLYYELENIFEEYNLNLDQELNRTNTYLNSLDTYVTKEIKIKKSQLNKLEQFLEELE